MVYIFAVRLTCGYISTASISLDLQKVQWSDLCYLAWVQCNEHKGRLDIATGLLESPLISACVSVGHTATRFIGGNHYEHGKHDAKRHI